MRILITSLICFLATCLPGQCIDVRVDSVFCLANGEYGILYDVEGTSDAGWVLEGYNVSGSYFTDEILSLTGLFGPETNLVFRDSIDVDCALEVSVQAPDGCGATDPCFGFGLEVEGVPGSCGQDIRARVFPNDVGIFSPIVVINQQGDTVGTGFPPDFPDFVDFNDLAPGDYTIMTTVNESCTLTQLYTITGSAACGSISGLVWEDANEDGVRNENERILTGVGVRLLNALDFNDVIAERAFLPDGGYFFNEVPVGQYVVQFDDPGSRVATAYQVGGDATLDNDMSADFITVAITVSDGDAVQNIDGGFIPLTAIGDFVFVDQDANGQQDAGDRGLEGVDVHLLDENGNIIVTTTTDAAGFYEFRGLTPGEGYVVEFESPAGFESSPSNQGDDAADSDADRTTGQTAVIVLEPGEYNPTTDAGFYETASIGDFVFFDSNANGTQDAGDSGLAGVETNLLVDGVIVITTTSDEDGFYEFTDLTPGEEYVVEFITPDGFFISPRGETSNIDPETGLSDVIVLSSGEENPTIDAGFHDNDCSVVTISDDVSCFGGEDGSVTADPTGQAPFTFEWSTGATTQSQFNLPAGTYTVTVTDATGCTVSNSINIGEPSEMIIVFSESGNPCDPTGGHILFTNIVGGVAPYTYEWSNGSTFGNLNSPENGVYSLIVTDSNGCSIEGQYRVDHIIETINFFAPFYLPCEGGSVTISVGDSTEYDYVWTSPSGIEIFGHTIEATEIGDYSVVSTSTVVGTCTISGVATVIQVPPLGDISLQVIDSSECGFGQCVFPVFDDPVNQEAPVTYTWYNPDGDVVSTNGFFCTQSSGLFFLSAAGPCDTLTLSIDLNSSVECSDINGTVYIDNAGNCSFDAGDIPAADILVHIASTDGTRNYYAVTNEDGEYGQEVETGEYTVTPITDPSRPFGQCDPAATVTVVAGQPNQLDVFLPVLLSCPLLTVDVSMPFLRRCFLSCAYIEYENEGSAVAEDAQLVVTLDPLFIGVDPSIVPSMIDGNTYTFDLGDLPPFASGRIYFNFTVSCDAELGQAHCLEAEITPNDICNDPEGWNGALVSVDPGTCDGNEVAFRIANIGDNEMSVPLSYVVVEDGIMMTPVPVVVEQLTPDEIFTVLLPADGQTYQLITNQEPNAPASETPTAVQEGCVGNVVNGGTTGFANILSLGNGLPSEAIVCRENVGAYDPNDKNGYPLGYGEENNIAKGTELDYAIRFQNTGTDTAFNVVVRDTISEALDLSTFKAGSSSHDYTVNIDSQRVVTFTFANIMLPDSNVSLLASQGVVNFTIDHSPELIEGDLITNEAAIYFDFNEPVITNVSRHQIEKGSLPVGIRTLQAREVSLRVFPNPSSGLIQLDVPNNDVSYNDVLTVTDLYGRQLAKTTYGQIGSGWDVTTLPAGYYLLVVHDEAGRARGRAGFIVAQ